MERNRSQVELDVRNKREGELREKFILDPEFIKSALENISFLLNRNAPDLTIAEKKEIAKQRIFDMGALVRLGAEVHTDGSVVLTEEMIKKAQERNVEMEIKKEVDMEVTSEKEQRERKGNRIQNRVESVPYLKAFDLDFGDDKSLSLVISKAEGGNPDRALLLAPLPSNGYGHLVRVADARVDFLGALGHAGVIGSIKCLCCTWRWIDRKNPGDDLAVKLVNTAIEAGIKEIVIRHIDFFGHDEIKVFKEAGIKLIELGPSKDYGLDGDETTLNKEGQTIW